MFHIMEELIKSGVKEVCVCPGKRNGPFLFALDAAEGIKIYPWYEERSAAFFALGRVRATGRPVAVVTTSGTAAGECLPAAMEAHYSGDPLILLTADRPRRFRGTGAPQSAEQVGLFSHYTSGTWDLEEGEIISLEAWSRHAPVHINVCLEEMAESLPWQNFKADVSPHAKPAPKKASQAPIRSFLDKARFPLVVVGALPENCRSHVTQQLTQLKAPLYLEGHSGLREAPALQSLRIQSAQSLWTLSRHCGYPIDAILRIGGVPTFRPWRDLEELQGKIEVLSLSETPFSGLSWGVHLQMELNELDLSSPRCSDCSDWLSACASLKQELGSLLLQFPQSEPALMRALSEMIGSKPRIYLGNSLPIREWDLAASLQASSDVWTSRGCNGIDGQISTFLGLCEPARENWGIFGDLTALYDFPALWILQEMDQIEIRIVVMNNGGGQIFSRLHLGERFINSHQFSFEHFALQWKLDYRRMERINDIDSACHQFIEVVPCPRQTEQFWTAWKQKHQELLRPNRRVLT